MPPIPSHRRALATIVALACVAAGARVAGAQAASDPRLAARLDARTRDAVAALIDSVRAVRIPSEPLVQKALEGASKRADGARIVGVVRALARELGDARGALGASSSDAEVTAAASALHAGIAPTTLARMRADRPHGSLTVALAVLVDLLARGVPGDTATAAITALSGAGARDADLLVFRQEVERDIAVGVAPAAAVGVRARGIVTPGAPPRRP